MVVLDAAGAVVRPAKLWNDTESAPDAGWLLKQLPDGAGGVGGGVRHGAGGRLHHHQAVVAPPQRARRRGPAWPRVLPAPRLADPPAHRRVHHRPGRRLGHRLLVAGRRRVPLGPAGHRRQATATGRRAVPEVLGPGRRRRRVARARSSGPGTGDNMAAALGLGLATGRRRHLLGTSGTVYAVSDTPTADATGDVAGFADATGRFLPLVCTLNAAKVTDAVARLLGVDHDGLDDLALAAPPGAGGLVLLPYLDGERTPNRPDGHRRAGRRCAPTSPREQLARAAFEGVVCGLLDGLDALAALVPTDGRLLLVGGGAAVGGLRARSSPTWPAGVVLRAGRAGAGGHRRRGAGGGRARRPATRRRWPPAWATAAGRASIPVPAPPPPARCAPPTPPGATPRRERPLRGPRPPGDGHAGRRCGRPGAAWPRRSIPTSAATSGACGRSTRPSTRPCGASSAAPTGAIRRPPGPRRRLAPHRSPSPTRPRVVRRRSVGPARRAVVHHRRAAGRRLRRPRAGRRRDRRDPGRRPALRARGAAAAAGAVLVPARAAARGRGHDGDADGGGDPARAPADRGGRARHLDRGPEPAASMRRLVRRRLAPLGQCRRRSARRRTAAAVHDSRAERREFVPPRPTSTRRRINAAPLPCAGAR